MNNVGRRININSFSSTVSEGDRSAYESMLFNDVVQMRPSSNNSHLHSSSVLQRCLKGYHQKLSKDHVVVCGTESVTTAPTEYSDHSSSFFEPEASVFSNMSTASSTSAKETPMVRQVSFEDEDKRRAQLSKSLSKRNLQVNTPPTVDELLNRRMDDRGQGFPEWKDFDDPFADQEDDPFAVQDDPFAPSPEFNAFSPPPTPPTRKILRDPKPCLVSPTSCLQTATGASPSMQALPKDLMRTALQVRSAAPSAQPIKSSLKSSSSKPMHRRSTSSVLDTEKTARLAEIERRYKEALECANLLHQELAANDVVAEVSPRQLLLRHASSRSVKTKSSKASSGISCAPSVSSQKTSATSKTVSSSKSGDSGGSGGATPRGRSTTVKTRESRSRAKSCDRTTARSRAKSCERTRTKTRVRSRSRPRGERRRESPTEEVTGRQSSNRSMKEQERQGSSRSAGGGDLQAWQVANPIVNNSMDQEFDPRAAPRRRVRRNKSGMEDNILDSSLPSSFHQRDLPIEQDRGFVGGVRPTSTGSTNGPAARRLANRIAMPTMAPVERHSVAGAALSLFLEQQQVPKPDPAVDADGWEDATGIWHPYKL